MAKSKTKSAIIAGVAEAAKTTKKQAGIALGKSILPSRTLLMVDDHNILYRSECRAVRHERLVN
ncbi:MAG: hypothetical protein PHR35_23110 [Kiritimatiellae bacterium]|nr:hypothetical protein [Kiritimatiellia bacterium]